MRLGFHSLRRDDAPSRNSWRLSRSDLRLPADSPASLWLSRLTDSVVCIWWSTSWRSASLFLWCECGAVWTTHRRSDSRLTPLRVWSHWSCSRSRWVMGRLFKWKRVDSIRKCLTNRDLILYFAINHIWDRSLSLGLSITLHYFSDLFFK